MKVICRYSGVEFRAEHFNFTSIGEHPLYSLPIEKLLGLFRIWVNSDIEAAKLSQTETKMLFIAFMKATDLIDFTVPASPDYELTIRFMPKIVEFVIFRQTIPDVEIRFPRISINELTRSCRNMSDWLDVWFTRKADYMISHRQEYLNQKLQQSEEILMKLIKSPMGDQARKIGRLAQWALIASDAPKHMHEKWTGLFKLKGLELFKADTDDLENLLGYMETKLPTGGMFAFETLRHLRELFARNSKGIFYNLSDGDDSLDPFELEKNPWRFIEDDLETINIKVAAAAAPLSEPVLSEYPNKVAYLQAKARFNLALSERQVKQIVEDRQIQALTKAALDNVEEDNSAEDAAEVERQVSDAVKETKEANEAQDNG